MEEMMNTLFKELEGKSNFFSEKGASEDDVAKAEKTLGLRFADDYREYLVHYGSVSCGGHELTGFSEDEYLDVVNVTLTNRKRNPNLTQSLYVIEEAHIDDIVVWQSSSGEIFQTQYQGYPQKVYASLKEYISTFENRDSE